MQVSACDGGKYGIHFTFDLGEISHIFATILSNDIPFDKITIQKSGTSGLYIWFKLYPIHLWPLCYNITFHRN